MLLYCYMFRITIVYNNVIVIIISIKYFPTVINIWHDSNSLNKRDFCITGNKGAMGDASRALLLCAFVTGAVCMMDFIGKGQWTVNNVRKCPDSDKYPMQMEVKRRKMNRTHDGFNVSLTLPDDLTETSHGIYLELCKHVDGGCKIQHIIDEKSVCDFVRQYAKENFVKALTMAGIDPPDCPIKAGYISLKNFVFDYSELPKDGFIGQFEAMIFLLRGIERLLCVILDVKFDANND